MLLQREYETIAIINPELPDEGIDRMKGRLLALLAKLDAKLIRMDNWGKRKLAFEVKKQAKGFYLYFLYLGNPGTVEEMERNLRMWDDVIRYQTVKVDDDVNPEIRPSEMSDEELKALEEATLRPASQIKPPAYETLPPESAAASEGAEESEEDATDDHEGDEGDEGDNEGNDSDEQA